MFFVNFPRLLSALTVGALMMGTPMLLLASSARALELNSCQEVFSPPVLVLSPMLETETILEILRRGEIEIVAPIWQGRSRPYHVRIHWQGRSVDAVMKDRGSETGRRREELAYRLDRILGFKLVPSTTLRQLEDGRLVSLQQFVIGEAAEANDDLRLFSALTGNIDRVGSNNVIQDRQGKQFAIDNEGIFIVRGAGLSFSDRLLLEGISPSNEVVERLRTLASGELRSALIELLPTTEAVALEERAQSIMSYLRISP